MGSMGQHEGWVGVFDSGVGGISVLEHLVRELPHERFLFFGDSANAPYGEKTDEEVMKLSRAIVEYMVHEGCKAIVIACNTATSVAAATLRAEYPDLPIIGVEPALKPATLAPKHRRVLVMATPVTLRLDKYHQLAATWGSDSEVISQPCPGLAARIEHGNLDAPDLTELIERLVGQYAGTVDSVVLGCTHYPFLTPVLERGVAGRGVAIVDPSPAVARRVAQLLYDCGLRAPADHEPRFTFRTFAGEEYCERLKAKAFSQLRIKN